MKKPFMEVIRFDSSDVILTSGAHTLNHNTVYCPADHDEALHFRLWAIDAITTRLSMARGFVYQIDKDPTVRQFRNTYFTDGQLPTEADIGKWYYQNGDILELCNGGQ